MSIRILSTATKIGARGSYLKLEYLPVSEVDAWIRIVDDYGKFIGTLSLKSFGVWRTMPNAPSTPKPYDIATRETKSGQQHTATANGLLIGGEGSDFRVLRDNKESRHLVRATLPNGTKLLLADYDFPAEFNYKIEGEGDAVTLRRISFSFTATSPNEICQL